MTYCELKDKLNARDGAIRECEFWIKNKNIYSFRIAFRYGGGQLEGPPKGICPAAQTLLEAAVRAQVDHVKAELQEANDALGITENDVEERR